MVTFSDQFNFLARVNSSNAISKQAIPLGKVNKKTTKKESWKIPVIQQFFFKVFSQNKT